MKKACFVLTALLLVLIGIAFAEETYYFEKDVYLSAPLEGEWKYVVEDTAILRVSTYGKFIGAKLGKTQIEADSGDKVLILEAEVVPKVTSITLSKTKIVLLMNETYAIQPTLKPDDARAKALKYVSSDESVATVDAFGLVTPVGNGTCKIKVSSAEKSAYLTVTVTEPITGLTFPEETYVVNVGKHMQLTPVFESIGASDDAIIWKSDNTSVATVEDGKVSAKKAGEAVITACLSNGLVAKCTVKVEVPVQTLKLQRTSIKIAARETYTCALTIAPSDATNQTLSFVSSDPSIASVDENGVITGISKGKCKITVTSANGKTAVMEVQVIWTPIKGIKNYTLQSAPVTGETYQIKAEVIPMEASEPTILYSSSAPEIAAVDENGLITAVSEGQAVITLTTQEGNFTSECKVTVRAEGESRLKGAIIGINPGHQIRQNPNKYPVAPGSKTMKVLNQGGTLGVKTGKYEYQLNLEVSLLLRDLLEDAGAEVVMVRTSNDVEITNVERAEMLNKANVDIAIQIHANTSNVKTQNGLSTYSKESGSMKEINSVASKLIHDALLQTTGANDAGIHFYDSYMSLNYSTTPAILVEMGYMSNAEEDVLLSTPEYQQKLAQGMFDGICDFLGR